jgi:hypothetical protein
MTSPAPVVACPTGPPAVPASTTATAVAEPSVSVTAPTDATPQTGATTAGAAPVLSVDVTSVTKSHLAPTPPITAISTPASATTVIVAAAVGAAPGVHVSSTDATTVCSVAMNGAARVASATSTTDPAPASGVTVSTTAATGAVPATTTSSAVPSPHVTVSATSMTGAARTSIATSTALPVSGEGVPVTSVATNGAAHVAPAATVSSTEKSIPASGVAVATTTIAALASSVTSTSVSATASGPSVNVSSAATNGAAPATAATSSAGPTAAPSVIASSTDKSGAVLASAATLTIIAASAPAVIHTGGVSSITVASTAATDAATAISTAMLSPPVTVSATSMTGAAPISTVTSAALPVLETGVAVTSVAANGAARVASTITTNGTASASGVTAFTAATGAVPATTTSSAVIAPCVIPASVSGTAPDVAVSSVFANASTPSSGVSAAYVIGAASAAIVSPITGEATASTVTVRSNGVTSAAPSVAVAATTSAAPAPTVPVSSAATNGTAPSSGVTVSSTTATGAITVSSELPSLHPTSTLPAAVSDKALQDTFVHSDPAGYAHHEGDSLPAIVPHKAQSSNSNSVIISTTQSQTAKDEKPLGGYGIHEAADKQIIPVHESNQSKMDSPAIPYLLAEIRAGGEMKAELLDRIAMLEAQTIELQKVAQSASAAAVLAAHKLEEETKKHIIDMSSLAEDAERRAVQKDHDHDTLVVQLAIARKILCQAGEDAKASAADRQDLEHRALLAMGQLEEHLKREGEARLAAEDKLRAIEEETHDVVRPEELKNDTDVSFHSLSQEPLSAQLLATSLPSLRAIATAPSTLPSLLTLYKNLGEVLNEQAGDGVVRPPRVPMYVGTAAAAAHADKGRGRDTRPQSERDVLLSFDNIYPTLESSCPSEASSARTVSPDTIGLEPQAFEIGPPKLKNLPPPRAASPIILSGSLITGEGRRGVKEERRGSNGDEGLKEEGRVGAAPSRAEAVAAGVDSILFIEDNPIVSATRRFSIRKMTGAEQTEIEDRELDIARQDRQQLQRLEMLDFESIYYAEEKPISTSGTPEQRPERRRGQKEAQKVADRDVEVKEKEKEKEKSVEAGFSQDASRSEGSSSNTVCPVPLFLTASRSSPERRGTLKKKGLFADNASSSQGGDAERSADMECAAVHHMPSPSVVAAGAHVNLDETLLPGPEELWSVPGSLTVMERNHIDRLRHEADSMDALDATLLDTHAMRDHVSVTQDSTSLDLSDLEFEAIQNRDSLGYDEVSTDAERTFCMEDLFLLGNQPITTVQVGVNPSPIREDVEEGSNSSPRAGNLSGFFQGVSRSPERRGRLKKDGKESASSVDANLCSPSSTPERIGAPVLEDFTFAEESSFSRRPLHGRAGHHGKHSSPRIEEGEEEREVPDVKVQELRGRSLTRPVVDCSKGKTSVFSAETTCATIDSPLAATSSALTPLDIGDGDSDCDIDMGPGTGAGSVRNLFQHESYSESEKTDVECAATLSPRPSNNLSSRGKIADDQPISRAERMVMLKLEWSVASIFTVFRTLAERVRASEVAFPHPCSLLQHADSSRMAEAFKRFKCYRLSAKEMLVVGPIHPALPPVLDANEAPLRLIFQKYCPVRRSEDSSRQRRACRHLSAMQTLDLLSEFNLQQHATR